MSAKPQKGGSITSYLQEIENLATDDAGRAAAVTAAAAAAQRRQQVAL